MHVGHNVDFLDRQTSSSSTHMVRVAVDLIDSLLLLFDGFQPSSALKSYTGEFANEQFVLRKGGSGKFTE